MIFLLGPLQFCIDHFFLPKSREHRNIVQLCTRFLVRFDRDFGFVVKAFCLDEGQQLATYAATKSGSGDMISDYYLNFLLFIRALLDMSLKTN